MPTETGVAGVLLAAGASRRLGEPKQLLRDATGTTAVVRMSRALHEAGCESVVVVLGAEAARVRDALDGETVHLVENHAWADGMGRSIAVGVETVRGLAPAAAAVLLVACDMPSVSAAHLRALCARAEYARRVASLYTRADGVYVRGIPAVLPRADWPWLEQLAGDQGARHVLQHADTLTEFLPDGAFDLDTPADVQRWRHAQGPAAPPRSS